MRRSEGYIFDLDGTVYRGSRLIAGADAALRRLRERGARIVFLSNNPVRSREQYAVKLNALGIPATVDEILNSSFVLVEELRREAPGARLFVAGEDSLKAELSRAGFRFTGDPAQTDFVILAFDRTFHYGKLLQAHRAVRAGARVWATNPDVACPTEEGDIPDCGCLIAALETCAGKKVDNIVGKPSATIVRYAAERLGVPLKDCLIVGDRLETDMQMARNAGCACALVLTGVTSRGQLKESPIQPDYVLESIAWLE